MDKPRRTIETTLGAGAPVSSEAAPKEQNSLADQVVEMLGRFQQRLTVNNPRLAERYIKSEIHLLIHFRVRGINEEFVAYLQRAEIIGRSEESLDKRNGPPDDFFKPTGSVSPYIETLIARSNSNQQAVLVDIVKLMEYPKIVSPPSFVWFERAQRVYSVLPHALYFSWKSGFVFIGAPLDQKIGMKSRSGVVRTDEKQLLSQMVEGTPKVLDNVASDSCETDRRGVHFGHIIDQLACLRIALSADCIRLGVEENTDCAIEVIDVLFGPFNFDLDKSKSFIGSHGDSHKKVA